MYLDAINVTPVQFIRHTKTLTLYMYLETINVTPIENIRHP